MFDDFPFFTIAYDSDEGGGGGGGSDEGGGGGGGSDEGGQETAVQENNQDISTLSKQIAGGGDGEEGNRKDPMSRHIGYFEEDIDPEGELSGGEEPPEGGEPGPDEDFEEEPGADDFEDEDFEDEDFEDTGEGTDQGDEDFDDDKFYVPDRDAKDRDVYPNEYPTRMDAQFAVSEKISTFDDYAEALEEVGSKVGAAIDPELKDKLEKYRDLDYANQVDDDELRSDIAAMDEGLKAVKLKVDRVKTKTQTKQRKKEAEKQYKKAEKTAQKSSQAIGLPERLNELPDGFDKGDLMELVDDQIGNQVAEIDQKIQNHRQDEEYIEKNSLEAWNRRLDELQDQRQEAMDQLNEHRDNIEEWWDAQQEYRSTQKEVSDPTDAELMKMRDEAYLEFQEDRSEGPNALDIFTKSKDTKPLEHFRQYAYSPANIDKFDLTTPEGWMRMYKDWQSWVNENVQSKKNGRQKKKSKKKDKKRKPIPAPSSRKGGSYVPNRADMDPLNEVNDDISKLSHKIMGG